MYIVHRVENQQQQHREIAEENKFIQYVCLVHFSSFLSIFQSIGFAFVVVGLAYVPILIASELVLHLFSVEKCVLQFCASSFFFFVVFVVVRSLVPCIHETV